MAPGRTITRTNMAKHVSRNDLPGCQSQDSTGFSSSALKDKIDRNLL